jgi:hypothetical protein
VIGAHRAALEGERSYSTAPVKKRVMRAAEKIRKETDAKKYPSGEYPGDSEDKRAVQDAIYGLAKDAPRLGHAITLLGTEAETVVHLMREKLNWPASRCWMVDWAKASRNREEVLKALMIARNLWPTANVKRENILETLVSIPTIGFADLDFMGRMRPKDMQPAIQMCVDRVLVGGVISVTWYRGRESEEEKQALRARGFTTAELGELRWADVERMVQGWAGETGIVLKPVMALEYQHGRSPMSVSAWRREK